jgi:iron complex transport system permease protein
VARRPAEALLAPLLLFALLALALVSVSAIGRYPLSIGQVLHILVTTVPFDARGHAGNAAWVVVEIVRLPRVMLVVLCGMGLALAGAAMQGVFRNPLVSPEIAGVSQGASFGGALAIALSFSELAVVGTAFLCGFIALATAFVLARVSGRGAVLSLVLAGLIVGTFFGALLGLTEYMAEPAALPAILYWLLGSFADATYAKVGIVSAVLLMAGTALLALRWRINLLSLGDVDARALGIDVNVLRWVVVALVAAIVAAQTSVSGGVAWVGLVVPHIARMIAGPEHSRLLPISALIGGTYLLAMDDIARSVGSQEIPIGFLTAAVGAPLFAYLFWKLGSRGWVT